jgi:hypothetical protein
MARRRTQALVAIATILMLAVVARALAPWAVEAYANRKLAGLGAGYRGTVADVDLALLRGGYTLYGVSVVQVDARQETPFVDVQKMDLTLQWQALLDRQVVGEVVMHAPILNFVQSKSAEERQYGSGVNWPQAIRDLFPFRLNIVQAVDGLITFRAPGIAAEQSLTARNVELVLRNLTNVENRETEAFAEIEFNGLVMGNAPVSLNGQIDPNEALPTFDIDLSLENARVVDVNPWLREFLKVDGHAGVFSLYAELAAADGRFEGYLRPILENPEFFDPEESATGPFKKAWEALVGLAAKILENRREQQVATEIPLSGEFENPKAGIVPTLVNLLRNAFVTAFAHSLAGSISFRDVGEDLGCERPERRRERQREPPECK